MIDITRFEIYIKSQSAVALKEKYLFNFLKYFFIFLEDVGR